MAGCFVTRFAQPVNLFNSPSNKRLIVSSASPKCPIRIGRPWRTAPEVTEVRIRDEAGYDAGLLRLHSGCTVRRCRRD